MAKCEARVEAGRFRLLAAMCFLSCVPLGWDAVVCGMATLAHSWNLDFPLCLFLSCTHVPMCIHHIATHSAFLPSLLHNGLCSWLLHTGLTFSRLSICSLVEKPRKMSDLWEYRFSNQVSSGPPSSCGTDWYLSRLWKTVCKTRICIFRSYTKRFNDQAGNIRLAWNDQSPQR